MIDAEQRFDSESNNRIAIIVVNLKLKGLEFT